VSLYLAVPFSGY